MAISDFGVIVEFIKIRRKIRRLTQKQVAERADVSPRTIFALERGDDSISVKTLFAVAKALEIKLEVHRPRFDQPKAKAKPRSLKSSTKDVWARG